MESKQAKLTNSLDRTTERRSRYRCVPNEMVGQGCSRPLPDNTAGTATWLDAYEPSRGGDLTRKRPLVRSR